MAEENPNLIPLPSIGESKSSLSGSQNVEKPKRSKLWLVVLFCVVAGIALGVFVYQQSIAPAPTPSKKPVATPRASLLPTAIPSPSPELPGINAVSPQSKSIVFPKAGEVRVYLAGYGTPVDAEHLVKLTASNGSADISFSGTAPSGDKMVTRDSGLEVTAGQSVTIAPFDDRDPTKPSYGWIKPNAANKCGATYDTDASAMVAWATQKSAGEPLVSVQCWGDWSAANDASAADYNDFLIILSYVPGAQAAAVSPSPSVSVRASASPSPSPSASATASRSPSPSPSASAVASKSPSPSPSSDSRVTMPEGSSLPEAGVFEVTAGTVGIGLVFILLGILGLLLI